MTATVNGISIDGGLNDNQKEERCQMYSSVEDSWRNSPSWWVGSDYYEEKFLDADGVMPAVSLKKW